MEGKSFRRKLVLVLNSLYYPLIAVVAAFLIGSVIIKLTSTTPPLEAYRYIYMGAFGKLSSWNGTLVKAIPFTFTALSFAIAKRCGIINLGGEGQFIIGALCGTIVGVYGAGLPTFIHLPLTLLAGFIGGSLYGFLVGVLKIRFGASELITTIMLNYIARQLNGYFVNGPIKDGSGYPQSAAIPDSAHLFPFIPGFRVHTGVIIVLLAVLFYYVFLWKTTSGFELRVVGLNPTAGQYAGMNINRASLLAMFLAGGIAGLGGCIEIIAVQDRLMITSFEVSYGFTGIAVALLGNNTPLGIILSGILFGGLQSGADSMKVLTDASDSVVQVVQALVILFVAGRMMFHFRRPKNLRRTPTAQLLDPAPIEPIVKDTLEKEDK